MRAQRAEMAVLETARMAGAGDMQAHMQLEAPTMEVKRVCQKVDLSAAVAPSWLGGGSRVASLACWRGCQQAMP